MSLESLQSQLNDKENDKSSLKGLITVLESLKGHVESIYSTLKSAAASIEKAGNIGGAPFDDGKTEEYAEDFLRNANELENAIAAVKEDIKVIDGEIEELKGLIAAEERRLELARQEKTKETENSESVHANKPGINAAKNSTKNLTR